MIPPKIKEDLSVIFQKADDKTHGLLGIFQRAIASFTHAQSLEAAAAIAYFAIFSVFPLLLALISVAGFLLKGSDAVQLVLSFIEQISPVSTQNLEQLIVQIVDQRKISGIVGLIGLVVSASAVFTTLARNVNRAWPNAHRYNILRGQLSAFGLIAIVLTLMILWVIWLWIIWILVLRGFPLLERIMPEQLSIPDLLNGLFPTLAAFIIFFIIYRWLPATRVPWRAAGLAALAASLAWTVLNLGFSWFLQSGFSTFDSLYGSLGTSIALLTWVYFSAMIILFGAHLSSSIVQTKK